MNSNRTSTCSLEKFVSFQICLKVNINIYRFVLNDQFFSRERATTRTSCIISNIFNQKHILFGMFCDNVCI